MAEDPRPDPGPVMGRILEAKRREVEVARAARPLEALREALEGVAPPRDFVGALTAGEGVALIAEIKKASPSKGLIREDFDPPALARAYERGGAACLSVLTDGPFFQGSTEIFRAVRAVTSLPMLRKEFMIDPYQFHEARAMGADAVLLITSILTDSELVEFHALARELGMAALVETHSLGDIDRALGLLEPRLLGINNRDLHHPGLHTDLAHTERMLPRVRELRPGGAPPLVGESGIFEPGDVARLRGLGVAAVLVGESLMRQDDVEAAVRRLMAEAGAPVSKG